jgi:hypothetical protein
MQGCIEDMERMDVALGARLKLAEEIERQKKMFPDRNY